MNVLEEAIIFATEKHAGQMRKSGKTPYILHPVEVAAVIATVTNDLDTMAAGVLHDVVEDCGVDPYEIREKFGSRVYALVQSETEDRTANVSPEDSWFSRKEESLLALKYTKDKDVRILWMGDKLSNMRSMARSYRKDGEKMWQYFHQKDIGMHAWYYRSIAALLKNDLGDTDAYREYVTLMEDMFAGVKESVPLTTPES